MEVSTTAVYVGNLSTRVTCDTGNRQGDLNFTLTINFTPSASRVFCSLSVCVCVCVRVCVCACLYVHVYLFVCACVHV